ncbi:hypothetical protein ACJJTC_001469 [Scirpophaga incertulas]
MDGCVGRVGTGAAVHIRRAGAASRRGRVAALRRRRRAAAALPLAARRPAARLAPQIRDQLGDDGGGRRVVGAERDGDDHRGRRPLHVPRAQRPRRGLSTPPGSTSTVGRQRGPVAVRAASVVRAVAGADVTVFCPYAGYPIRSIEVHLLV